jgi:hypothetical protein
MLREGCIVVYIVRMNICRRLKQNKKISKGRGKMRCGLIQSLESTVI